MPAALHRLPLPFFTWSMIAMLLPVSLLPQHAASQGPLPLVTEGRPTAAIVLPREAGPRSPQRRTADLLAGHLLAMTGARLPVHPEQAITLLQLPGQPPRLALAAADTGLPEEALLGQEQVPGETAGPAITTFLLVGESELTRQLGVSAANLGPGGFRLVSVGSALVLLGGPTTAAGVAGNDANGLHHAALELLEILGCGFLWPGPGGQVIPRSRDVIVPAMDRTHTPPIQSRTLRWARWSDRSDIGLQHLEVTLEALDAWRAARYGRAESPPPPIRDGPATDWLSWHRQGGRMPNFGHAGGGLRHDQATTLLRTAPDWFALQADGTRDQGGDPRWALCLSNRDLIDYVATDLLNRLDNEPTLSLVSLDFNDGGSNTGWCLCTECQQLDPPNAPRIQLTTYGKPIGDGPRRQRLTIDHPSLSDRAVWYWNQIAERVTRQRPDVRLGISVYSAWVHPPVREKLHPNLVARYVPETLEHLAGWQAAGLKNVFWRPNILLFNRRDGKLKSFVQPLAGAMNALAGAGIRQTDFDSIMHHWATAGPSYYAAARLNWDPTLSAEQILDDFTTRGFGPAAAPIRAFFERIEALSRQGIASSHTRPEDYRFTPATVAALRALLHEAEARTNDPAILERIAFLRLGLNFTELQETLDDLARRAQAGDATVNRAAARRLLDLNHLVMLDHLIRLEPAINTAAVAWGSGGFAKWRSLDRQPARISDPALRERLADPRYGQTGREESLADLFSAFGMED